MRITDKHRFLYGLGYMGILIAGVIFTNFSTYFYIQHVKLDPALVGIGVGIISACGALIAPFIGYISDKTRTRWGRRTPYVVIGIPLVALFLWLLFTPAYDSSQAAKAMIWLVSTLFLADSIFMVIDVNWQAVNAEMNIDLKARSKQGAIVGVFSMLGIAIASSGTMPLAEKFGWSKTVGFVAVFSIVLGYIGILGLKENPKLLKPQNLNLKTAISETISYIPSRFYIGIATCVKIAMFSMITMIPLFTVWVLRLTEGKSGIFLFACSGGMIFILPFAAILINKFGPRRGLIGGFISLIILTASLLLPISNYYLLVTLFGLLAISFSLLMLSQVIMLGDLIDADALKMGERREGIYNSTYAFVQRVGTFIFSISMGALLSWTGFKPELSAQSGSVMFTIKALLAAVPLAVAVIGLFLAFFYPISDEKAKDIRDQAIKQREELLNSQEGFTA